VAKKVSTVITVPVIYVHNEEVGWKTRKKK
jgi:glutaredoxin